MQEIVFDFDLALTHYNYWMFVVLMMTGLYITVSRGNFVKKVVGLNIFQTAVFLLYISMGKIIGGTPPILIDDPDAVYSNPLPQVLILTAIVVGIATTALALALVVRIHNAYGTIEEDDILAMEHQMDAADPAQREGSR